MGLPRPLPATMTQSFKVRLESSSDPSDRVIFDVTPEISENVTVNYQGLNPVHMPGNIWVYQNTESRNFGITAKLVARTTTEARRNLEYFNLLRGWCQPYFGLGTAGSQKIAVNQTTLQETSSQTSTIAPGTGQQRIRNLLGSPPDVLYFYAYSDVAPDKTSGTPGVSSASRSHLGNIYRVPVVIKSFDHTYPSDVDYIPTAAGGIGFDQSDERTSVPFPVLMNITLSLLEVHSPNALSQNFDLYSYKLGILPEF